jgi:hypothetical protein
MGEPNGHDDHMVMIEFQSVEDLRFWLGANQRSIPATARLYVLEGSPQPEKAKSSLKVKKQPTRKKADESAEDNPVGQD